MTTIDLPALTDMTINEIRELLEYDAWATRQLLDAAQGLSAEAWARDLGGPHTSVRQQFVHLVCTVDHYRALLQGRAPAEERPEAFPIPATLLSYDATVRQRMNALLDELSPDVLNRVSELKKKEGVLHVSPADVLRHVVNHGTYHRGQAAALLKLHGVDFAETDYISWKNRRNTVSTED